MTPLDGQMTAPSLGDVRTLAKSLRLRKPQGAGIRAMTALLSSEVVLQMLNAQLDRIVADASYIPANCSLSEMRLYADDVAAVDAMWIGGVGSSSECEVLATPGHTQIVGVAAGGPLLIRSLALDDARRGRMRLKERRLMPGDAEFLTHSGTLVDIVPASDVLVVLARTRDHIGHEYQYVVADSFLHRQEILSTEERYVIHMLDIARRLADHRIAGTVSALKRAGRASVRRAADAALRGCTSSPPARI